MCVWFGDRQAVLFLLRQRRHGAANRDRELPEGELLDAGAMLGKVRTSRAEHPVASPIGGVLVEWLASDGDPVTPGQPLVRLGAPGLAEGRELHHHVGGMA